MTRRDEAHQSMGRAMSNSGDESAYTSAQTGTDTQSRTATTRDFQVFTRPQRIELATCILPVVRASTGKKRLMFYPSTLTNSGWSAQEQERASQMQTLLAKNPLCPPMSLSRKDIFSIWKNDQKAATDEYTRRLLAQAPTLATRLPHPEGVSFAAASEASQAGFRAYVLTLLEPGEHVDDNGEAMDGDEDQKEALRVAAAGL